MAAREWEARRAATGCRFCRPRADVADILVEVAPLSMSTLFVERIQTYRGHCVLVFDPRHATRIDELTAAEWAGMAADIRTAEIAVQTVFSPDHINVASIGQVVPHLHWHIVPRYVDDPRWGGPIWMTSPAEMNEVYLTPAEYTRMAERIRAALPN
ncbi:MAG: HIT family protein [Gammaproteobacteria bacterium]|nr:HIT family protein [Gammaproteobacteria bacterium]